MVGSPVPVADNGRDLWRLWVEEAALSVAAGPCLRNWGASTKAEVRPYLYIEKEIIARQRNISKNHNQRYRSSIFTKSHENIDPS